MLHDLRGLHGPDLNITLHTIFAGLVMRAFVDQAELFLCFF